MTRVALFSATLYVSQVVLSFLPNVELVTLLIILYTLAFGKETLLIVTVFNLFEGMQWGFGLWWFSYLYTWPVLCLAVLLLRKFIKEEFTVWAVVAGAFGLLFGSFFAIVYLPVDPAYALTYWLSGLPWDLWHAVWNFVLMVALGKPLFHLLKKVKPIANGY
jgi:hypothetical protein